MEPSDRSDLDDSWGNNRSRRYCILSLHDFQTLSQTIRRSWGTTRRPIIRRPGSTCYQPRSKSTYLLTFWHLLLVIFLCHSIIAPKIFKQWWWLIKISLLKTSFVLIVVFSSLFFFWTFSMTPKWSAIWMNLSRRTKIQLWCFIIGLCYSSDIRIFRIYSPITELNSEGVGSNQSQWRRWSATQVPFQNSKDAVTALGTCIIGILQRHPRRVYFGETKALGIGIGIDV